jgi:Kef-type K+ transport system membrane component KefB
MSIMHVKTMASFGMVIGASLSNGRVAKSMNLPAISGFLLTGLIAGPSVLGILDVDQISALQPIDHIALSFIALMAGSELRLESLKSQLWSILAVMFGLSIVTLGVTGGMSYTFSEWIPSLQNANTVNALAASLLLGTIMVARSPSAAIALIDELGAKGRFTQLILGVTVLMDVLVITLFAAALSVSQSLVNGQSFSLSFLAEVGLELSLSGVLGLGLAKVLRSLLRTEWRSLFSAPLLVGITSSVYLCSELIHHTHLMIGGVTIKIEPLLACLVAGIWLSNQTDQSHQLEKLAKQVAPWVYVAFFTITGASLELDQLLLVWPLAIALFLVRLVGLALGATLGGMIAGEPSSQHAYRWMGFVTQAGVGLGLAKRLAVEFPDWGPSLSTLIIAVIVMNEIFGPLFFKEAISRSGEVSKDDLPPSS